jgi:hypothetical protein
MASHPMPRMIQSTIKLYKIQSSVAGLVLTASPLMHFAAFHYEINLLQYRDIGQRIAL